MRTAPVARNRALLVVTGLLSLLAAAWLAAGWFDLQDRWAAGARLLPASGQPLGAIWREQHGWLLPVLAALAVVLVVLGLLVLLRQVPWRPRALTLRVVGDDGTLLGSVEPAVVEKALEGRVGTLPGVLGAHVQVSGAASAAHVQCELQVASSAEVGWVVAATRERLASDVTAALAHPPSRVDVFVRLRNPARRRAGATAVAPTRPSEPAALS